MRMDDQVDSHFFSVPTFRLLAMSVILPEITVSRLTDSLRLH